MKKYIAKTDVSINIMLPAGTNRHIAFSAITGGGSVFYTDDPEIIQGLERHYKYGKLFRADPQYNAEKQHIKPAQKPKKKNEATEAPAMTEPAVIDDEATAEESYQPEATEAEVEEMTEEAEEENGFKTIVVSDPDSAKAYLAEHFGYSRTKIKTLKAIKEAAAANGIVFEGI